MTIKEKRELGLKGVPNAYIAECEQIIDWLYLRTLTKEQVFSTLQFAPGKRFWVICKLLKLKVD